MNRITRKDVNKLLSAPLSYALLMENEQLEEMIVAFVSALNKRNGGGENQ